MLQVKFVLCVEIKFFVSCIILGIVNEPFWCEIHFVFAELVCSFNPSAILGLIAELALKTSQISVKIYCNMCGNAFKLW